MKSQKDLLKFGGHEFKIIGDKVDVTALAKYTMALEKKMERLERRAALYESTLRLITMPKGVTSLHAAKALADHTLNDGQSS